MRLIPGYLTLAIIFAWPASTTTTDDLSGTTVVTNLRLDHDLTCAGNGLVVGADGIRIDLDGHTIAGPGSGVGIAVSGRAKVLMVGGTVRNFATGLLLSNSIGVLIRGNRFIANGDGVDVQAGSIGNTIIENHFQDHGTRGIMLRSGTSSNLVKENTFTGNRVGVLMFGPAATTVKENSLSFSTLAGIRINVLATGNLVAENTISSNPAGIDFIGSAPGNTLRENTLNLNQCGLRGPSTGNTLAENVFLENTVDICP